MLAQPRRTSWEKSLRLACWKADGVCGRSSELNHFLGQNGDETPLRPGKFFPFANHVCHPTDRVAKEGETAYWSVWYRSLRYNRPWPGAFGVILTSRSMKIPKVYLSAP